MFSSESHLWGRSLAHAVGVGAGGVAKDGRFQSVYLCVCFGSECGGRRVWGWMEEDEEVENTDITD